MARKSKTNRKWKRKAKRKVRLHKGMIGNAQRTYRQIFSAVIPVGLLFNAPGPTTQNLRYAIPINAPGYLAYGANQAMLTYTGTDQSFNTVQSIGGNMTSKQGTLTGLFDQYKINKMTVRYLPNETDTKVNSGVGDLLDYSPIAYIYPDYDDMVLPLSEAECIGQGARPLITGSALKFHTRTMYSNLKGSNKWLNTSVIPLAPTTAVNSSNVVAVNYYQSIKILFPNITGAAANGAKAYFGRLFVDYDITFRGLVNN